MTATIIHAASRAKLTSSNGTTPVTIIDAPGASTTRTVPIAGGITIYNPSSTSLTFTVSIANSVTTNGLVSDVLGGTNTYSNDIVIILDGTTNTVEFVGATAFGATLKITTHWMDQAQ